MIRIEFDPNTFGVVKSKWVIIFHFTVKDKLDAVTVKRYLTGP